MLGALANLLLGPIRWITGGARAVYDGFKRVWHALQTLFHHTFQAWDWLIRGAETLAHWIPKLAEATYQGFRGVVHVALVDLRRFLLAAIHDVRDFFEGVIRDLRQWAADAINAVTDFAKGIPHWVIEHVWNPLKALIDDVVTFVKDHVIPFLKGLIDTLTQFVRDAFKDAWRAIADAWNWIQAAGKFVYALVKGAESWLLIMVRFPVSFLLAMIEIAKSFTADGLASLFVRALENNGSAVEDWVARWFGE